jgi:hypothetical protein
MKSIIFRENKVTQVLLFGAFALATILAPFMYAYTVEADTSPSTVTFLLEKKFSGPVPEGYTADQFVFKVEGDSFGPETVTLTDFNDDSANGSIELPVGTYTLTEDGPTGFDPAEWTVQWAGAGCDNQTALSTIIEVDESDLDKDAFGCDADNEWRHGILTIEKEVVGADDDVSNFSFVVTHKGNEIFNGPFDDDEVKVAVAIGNYSVVENNAPNFTTTYSDECSGTMEEDTRVTCTITNTYIDDPTPVPGCVDSEAYNFDEAATTDDGSCEYPVVSLCKVDYITGYPLADWYLYLDGEKNYGATTTLSGQNPGCVMLDPVAVGTYTLGEMLKPGWRAVSGNGDTVVVDSPTHTFTIENEALPLTEGVIVVQKEVEVGHATDTAFTFTSSWGDNFSLYDGEQISSDPMATGTYSVAEIVPVGWENPVVTCESSLGGYEDPVAIDLNGGEMVTCLFKNSMTSEEPEPTYKVFGYVWHDSNENDIWDGRGEEETEEDLDGWTVTITNGEKTYSTTTDEVGYYEFYVPAGTWTISETVVDEWQQTFPNDNGVYVVEVIDETADEGQEQTAFAPAGNFLTKVVDLFLPAVALAQTPTTYGEYNFGNVFTGGGDGGGGGGGGSSGGGGGTRPPRCEFSIEGTGTDAELVWETRYGRELWITADGEEIFRTTDEDEVDAGNFPYTLLAETDFELTVKRFSHEETCQVSARPSFGVGGAAPEPMVLGEQVSVVPVGAPNTGAGGAAPLSIPSPSPFVAMLMSKKRNVFSK